MPIQIFLDSLGHGEEEAFIAWQESHHDAYVLNPSSASGPILHKVGCRHLKWDADTHSMTSTEKITATDADTLRR